MLGCCPAVVAADELRGREWEWAGGGRSSSGILTHRSGGERQSQQSRACSSPPFLGFGENRQEALVERRGRGRGREGG